MFTLQHILLILRQHKPELQRKYPLSRMGLFGSYARGEATEKSDIDIAVEFSAPMGLNFVAMADEIEGLFGIKTDVVSKRSIKPGYLEFVEKDIVYVWKKKLTYYKGYAYRLFLLSGLFRQPLDDKVIYCITKPLYR